MQNRSDSDRRPALKRRAVRETDLTLPWKGLLAPEIRARFDLDSYSAALQRVTAERLTAGEFEHLVYYILQSRLFTARVPVEPALSALDFVEGMTPDEQARFLDGAAPSAASPSAIQARIDDFLSAVKRRDRLPDERFQYFRQLVLAAGGDARAVIRNEYVRTMRFLYRKEFSSRRVGMEGRADFVAQLYRQRAHSTDTQVEAGFGVDLALATLGQARPRPVFTRVLIVGPGHDLAPRTGFLDGLPPQSFQPFAVLDSLLRHELAESSRLSLHCVDINPRVVTHLGGLSGRVVRLDLVSGLSTRGGVSFSREFREYFEHLGGAIGREVPFGVPAATVERLRDHLTRRIEIGPSITRLISADRLNIIGERYDPSPQFDLVVVTNVFPYFEAGIELPLAVANLAAMISPGGYLVHNELSIAAAPIFRVVGLPMVQARTMTIATTVGGPLYDGVAVHRRE